MADRQPTEQELRARLEEELKRVRVDQVVLEATVSILNVAAIRAGLGPGGEQERDLDQVRVGIDAVRALLPVVEQVSGEQARPLRDALAQLQMTYVRAVGAEGGAAAAGARDAPAPGDAGAAAGPPGGGAAPGGRAPEPPRPGEPGPAQRSGRLWVPGQ
jgi:hypothetical protein